MSTSEARVLANRANALKSTGPRTEEGKLQSRRNALRHGLASGGDVMLPADEAKLAERRRSWGAVLQPTDEVERYLVEQAVRHSVKLDRCSAVESALAFEAVERADDEYEAEALGRLERAEGEVRQWTRLHEELERFGTIERDGLDAIFRLFGVGGSEDGRRYDLFALARAASTNSGSRDEAARLAAREALGDLIGARLEERRREVARIFEEIEGPEGRALARAKAALDTSQAGQLARRYEDANERGLLRMLKHLEALRRAQGGEAPTPLDNPSCPPEQDLNPSNQESAPQIDEPGKLGKLPNEPNKAATSGRSENPGNLGRLPNEAIHLVATERSEDLGKLRRLPNEANLARISEGLGGGGCPVMLETA